MNGAPEWEFPKMMHLLPSNAKSFGERLEAPRKPYIREDLALAMVAAAYEAAAQACGDDAYARGLPDQLTACAEAIRALTPDDARAALARMMAERAAPKWQPIETAPKDGTRVVLFMDDEAIEGWFVSGSRFSGWRIVAMPSHGCGCCSYTDPEPTHWMPLPDAPEASE